MHKKDLAAEADAIRAMIARLPLAGNRKDDRVRAVIGRVEGIAQHLLQLGAADPDLKAEIIGWVVEFRSESARLQASAARSDSSRPRLSPPAVPGDDPAEPSTKVFDYNTTDNRTPYQRRRTRKNRWLRVNFGSTPSAIAFGERMVALRQDVEKAFGTPGSDPSLLLDRIVRLYETRKDYLGSNYEHEVRDELDGMAIRVAGTTAREVVAKRRPKTPVHRSVPNEVAPIFGKQIVSGGLPTLGRGRR